MKWPKQLLRTLPSLILKGDEKGELQLNLVDGAGNFTNKVHFIASECNTLAA